MAAIPESYIGPSLRWSIYKETHPHADFSWKVVKGVDIGIPESFGGDADIVLVTIDPRDGTETVDGWVDVPAEGTTENGVKFYRNPDSLNMLVTKALGRACKRAGLPDTSDDLRTALLFQQRQAEIRVIEAGGRLTPALPPAPQVLEIAPTSVSPVPAQGGGSTSPQPTTTPLSVPEAIDNSHTQRSDASGAVPPNNEIRSRVVALGEDAIRQFQAFLTERGIDLRAGELEGLQLRVVTAYVDALVTKYKAAPTAEESFSANSLVEIEEVLAGFSNQQLARFIAWLNSKGLSETEGIRTVALFTEAVEVLEAIAGTEDEPVEDATMDVVEVFGGEFVQDVSPREYPPGEEPF